MALVDDPQGTWNTYMQERRSIKQIQGIVAVGLSVPSVMAYARRLSPSMIRELPEDVGGIPLVVKETGSFLNMSYVSYPASSPRTTVYRPAPGGISVGHYLGSTGTHGCAVTDSYDGQVKGIGSGHVTYLQWGTMVDGMIGDIIVQPGLHDATDAPGLGYLERGIVVPPIESGSAKVDAAIYSGDFDMEVIGIGLPSYAARMEPGMLCGMSGRSGLKRTMIESVGAIVDVEGYGVARLEDVAITRDGVAIGGDSGALMFDNWARSLGIVAAGNSLGSVVCEATEVELELGVTFGFADPHLLNLQELPSVAGFAWAPLLVGGLLAYYAVKSLR